MFANGDGFEREPRRTRTSNQLIKSDFLRPAFFLFLVIHFSLQSL